MHTYNSKPRCMPYGFSIVTSNATFTTIRPMETTLCTPSQPVECFRLAR